MKPEYKERIFSFYQSRKRMPTITEVMALCKLKSRNSAFYVVNALVKQGLLEKDTSGKILPVHKPYTLPLVGHIRAGFAAPAEEELADTITVGEYIVPNPEASYLLEVVGDSMEGAGIYEGDMVVFERRSDAKLGDIVVALTEDGYTLKYLRKDSEGHYLEPANENYPNLRPSEGHIIGVVVATFRTYTK
jgi:SOS regulatory protein LexA